MRDLLSGVLLRRFLLELRDHAAKALVVREPGRANMTAKAFDLRGGRLEREVEGRVALRRHPAHPVIATSHAEAATTPRYEMAVFS